MASKEIFFAKGDDPKMIEAFKKAQETFKYFWRELSWEYHRIVPGLDFACVKVAFTQDTENPDNPIVEHMWINEVDFDGETIKGVLINDPNDLTNVKNGDSFEITVDQISDWMFATQGKSYGGFTVQTMRSLMNDKERKEHDKAWGLNFGDYNEVLLAFEQKEHPENLIEHPMSVNMREKLIDFLKDNPGEITNADDLGYTLLHRETIAGNKTSVELLLQSGANINAKTNKGKTALNFAKDLNWEHLIPILEI